MDSSEKSQKDISFISSLFYPPPCEKIKTTLIYLNISCLFILITLCIHFLNLQITFTVTLLSMSLVILITYQLYISIVMPSPITCKLTNTNT